MCKPLANICKGFAHHKTGKLTQVGRVKCYAVKQENYLPTVRAFRWNNFRQLLACKNESWNITELIGKSLPKNTKIVRIHSSGDYYSFAYFMAWVNVARFCPNIQFFGYTKHLTYASYECLPENFHLVYSYGSVDDKDYDAQYTPSTLPTCFIEEFKGQYDHLGLERVCANHADGWQDYEKILNKQSFIIPIH